MAKRLLLSILTICLAAMTLATPASALPGTLTERGWGTPALQSSPRLDWLAGSSQWVHFSWTTKAEIENVKVRLLNVSRGMTVEYPNNAEYSGLMVDSTLSSNEIDFTAVKITTDVRSRGGMRANIEISWDQDGKTRTAMSRISLSNKRYRGEDFAILTEAATITTKPDSPEDNWVEFAYKGLAPTTTNMAITASGDLEAYHPQETFTSLHHDQTLHAGEVDVARVWYDPELVKPGSHTILVTIEYTDSNGRSKKTEHKVQLTAS